jgi:hypothetical protein
VHYTSQAGYFTFIATSPFTSRGLAFLSSFQMEIFGRMATVGWWVVPETMGGGWVDRREVREEMRKVVDSQNRSFFFSVNSFNWRPVVTSFLALADIWN